jgi:hypothetical protein
LCQERRRRPEHFPKRVCVLAGLNVRLRFQRPIRRLKQAGKEISSVTFDLYHGNTVTFMCEHHVDLMVSASGEADVRQYAPAVAEPVPERFDDGALFIVRQ